MNETRASAFNFMTSHGSMFKENHDFNVDTRWNCFRPCEAKLDSVCDGSSDDNCEKKPGHN